MSNIIEKEIMEKNFSIWCAKFKEVSIEQLSREMAFTQLALRLEEISNTFMSDDLSNNFMFKVIDKRADYIKLNLSKYAKNFLCLLSTTPGIAVMYLYYLKHEIGENEVTMSSISKLFPKGFPTKKSLDELWDAQKVNGDNLLDMF